MFSIVLTLALVIALIASVIISTIIIIFDRKKFKKDTEDLSRTLLASRRIYRLILEDLDFHTVVQKIADTIPSELEFGTGVVAILDETKGVIKRVGASRTKEAQQAIKALSIPFELIEIPITDKNNLMARALREHRSYITTHFYDVVGPMISPNEAERVQKIMGTKTTLVYPIFLKDKPLGVFIASTKKEQSQISPFELYIVDDFVNLVGLVLQNSQLFTSLKEAKEELSKVNNQLSQANTKLKDLDKLKDDFVSIVSHELRTPMTAIRSYAWMALNRADIALSEKMKKYIQRTLISTDRLINLVNEMLNISRIESGRIELNPSAFKLEDLSTEIIDEVDAKAKEKQLIVKIEKSGALVPEVFADSDKVHQVLLNLVGNAMKFTPAAGNITISFFSDGKMVETSVTDSGVGINPADMSHLFQKFGRLDSSYVAAATSGGTGLGLYICKSLIEMMGGKIWAKSDGVNKGTTFTFSLPVATPEKKTQVKAKIVPRGEVKGLEPVVI